MLSVIGMHRRCLFYMVALFIHTYSFLNDARALIFIYVIMKVFAVAYQVIGWSSKYLIWKHVS